MRAFWLIEKTALCVQGTVLTSNLPTQLTQISPFMLLSDKDCVSGNNILLDAYRGY